MPNFNQRKYTSKSGKEYTFQFPGVRAASQIGDRIKNKFGVPSEEAIGTEMMKHVIVEPKVTWDSFDSKKEFNDVIAQAYRFLEGEDDDEEVTDGDDK